MRWAVIWMVAGGFALGLAMNGTGLAENAVKSIPFDTFNPLVIMVVSGLVCFALSNFISNTATAALLIRHAHHAQQRLRHELAQQRYHKAADNSKQQRRMYCALRSVSILAPDRARYNDVRTEGNARMLSQPEEEKRLALRLEANRELADMIRELSQDTLDKVLYERSNGMKNAYARADA